MGLMILYAAKGTGKTTVLRAHAHSLATRGRSVGGIASPAVFESDIRIGYDVIDLRTGHRRRLARIAAEPQAGPAVGPYRFDAAALAAGNAAITAAVRDGLDTIAIDEVGPLEFDGQGWAPAVEYALRACGPAQELIIVTRPSLAYEFPARFPSPLWASAKRISPPWPTTLQA